MKCKQEKRNNEKINVTPQTVAKLIKENLKLQKICISQEKKIFNLETEISKLKAKIKDIKSTKDKILVPIKSGGAKQKITVKYFLRLLKMTPPVKVY